jgi:hypothetical protein
VLDADTALAYAADDLRETWRAEPSMSRVEHPSDLIPAYRRVVHATEEGRAALVKVLIKPMRMPELPDD